MTNSISYPIVGAVAAEDLYLRAVNVIAEALALVTRMERNG